MAQLMANHGESARRMLMGVLVGRAWRPPAPQALGAWLRRFRPLHRLSQCGRSSNGIWLRAMAGCNNPMLAEGSIPMRPWRGAGSGCSHNLTVRSIKLA
jgi:hypothetical protein